MDVHRNNRVARIERTYGVQWKNRIFGTYEDGFDVRRPSQLLPVGEQNMPELRILVQPMFQQHYTYFMAHRYFNESLEADKSKSIWDVLSGFTMRYTNPNASEAGLLTNFYPEVDDEALQHMTLADIAVRWLLDSNSWQRPTDSKHFSKACSSASKPKQPLAVRDDETARLAPLMDQ